MYKLIRYYKSAPNFYDALYIVSIKKSIVTNEIFRADIIWIRSGACILVCIHSCYASCILVKNRLGTLNVRRAEDIC